MTLGPCNATLACKRNTSDINFCMLNFMSFPFQTCRQKVPLTRCQVGCTLFLKSRRVANSLREAPVDSPGVQSHPFLGSSKEDVSLPQLHGAKLSFPFLAPAPPFKATSQERQGQSTPETAPPPSPTVTWQKLLGSGWLYLVGRVPENAWPDSCNSPPILEVVSTTISRPGGHGPRHEHQNSIQDYFSWWLPAIRFLCLLAF